MASRCRGFISGAANIGAATQGQIEPAFQLDADLHAQPTTWPGLRQPHVDHSCEWARLSEIGDDGCLLVRPDHHVAWRATGMSAAPEADLSRVLRTVLDR